MEKRTFATERPILTVGRAGKTKRVGRDKHVEKLDGSNLNRDPIAISVRNHMPETLPDTLKNLET